MGSCLGKQDKVINPENKKSSKTIPQHDKKDKSSTKSNEDFKDQNKSDHKNKQIKVEDVKAKQNLGDNCEINDDEPDCVRSIFLWVI